MSQPWQPQYNPGHQPPVPQQPPGPPQGFGGPPPFGPGQFPAQPAYPNQAPYGQQPRSGNPVGAFFLGFLVSFFVAMIYSVVIYATAEDQSRNVGLTLYILHALLNGAAVGAVVGLVGRRSVGAWISGIVVAMLGTFFGFANGMVFMYLDIGGMRFLGDMLMEDPFFPAKAWWGSRSGTELHSLLGLVVAAAAAWGLAFVTGRNRR
ncbi:hypothetical protein ABZX62_32255 [Streptomyces flavidovirens]|uniref:Integral membrane protein n=1 Tax=Streptomyces flavidovirens TaxID=67298 RepID=A0ABW6R9Y5_9ACTN